MQRSAASLNGNTFEDINGKLYLNGKPIQTGQGAAASLADASIDELVEELKRRGASVQLVF